MAAKTTLNAKNLEGLGAPRLSELVLELAEGNAAAKRRARAELCLAAGPNEAAKFISKRLAAIRGVESDLDRDQDIILGKELEGYRRMISERIGVQFPEIGLELVLQLIDLAPFVSYRQNHWDGLSEKVFQAAAHDLRDIAIAAETDHKALADHALRIILDDSGQNFRLLAVTLGPALGKGGLERLKTRLKTIKEKEAEKICGYTFREYLFKQQIAAGLRGIAFFQRDVAAFIRHFSKHDHALPEIVAELAERLIEADRAKDALKLLDAINQKLDPVDFAHSARSEIKIRALDKLGRQKEAQDERLAIYREIFSARMLREYLKRLPEFEDIEAEERELDFAMNSNRPLSAFRLLLEWPDYDRAAKLVLSPEIEDVAFLNDVPDHLLAEFELRHPLAATLIYRCAIAEKLMRGGQGGVQVAAKLLLNCDRLAPLIEDFDEYDSHDEYLNDLRSLRSTRSKLWRAKFWRIFDEMRVAET